MPIPISTSDLPPTLWQRVRDNLGLLRKARPLNREALQKLREQLRLLHTYNSNAIEGNTLSLRETQLVVEQGVTIGGKSLREHLEAINTAKAFDWVCELAKPGLVIDHVVLQELHELVMRGSSEWAGRYRMQNVRIGGSDRGPPQPAKIIGLLDALFSELRGPADPLVKSIYLHHRLVSVHPFLDGNGRTTRLAANLLLLSHGYPAIVLRASDRMRYYETLQEADRGDYRGFARFVVRAVDESLALHLAAVRPARALVLLRELARDGPYSQEYLSFRARQGALEAVRIGRNWYSSREALANYRKAVKA
jgi:Fic family protein